MAIQIDENEFLSRIYDKIEKIDNNLTELRVTSAKQEENIRTHVYRTELNEANVETLRKQLEFSVKQFEEKLAPVLQRESQVTGMIKLFGAVAAVIGTLGTVATIIYYFIK